MVKIIRTMRKAALLTPSSLACLSHIPTVNLTLGCAHSCLYCYTRGYSAYPGEGAIALYANFLGLLRNELRRNRQKTFSIYFSPASDLFQPVPEVQDLAYVVLQEIFKAGIGVSFLTKGEIPERHMVLLREHAPLVRAQIGLITTNDALLGLFEPNAAPAAVRIAQMKRLTESGIKTQIRVDPILPGLTDDQRTFHELCRNAAAAGITEAAASTLFLRPTIMRRLIRAAEKSRSVATCLKAFSHSQQLAIHAEKSSVTALPKEERERIFQQLEKTASCYKINLKRCSCKNPDIAAGICSIAGEQLFQFPIQTTLFD